MFDPENMPEVEEVTTAEQARDLAVEWQHWQSEQSMTWGETGIWQDYFEQLAEKFPELAEEFRENAIIGSPAS